MTTIHSLVCSGPAHTVLSGLLASPARRHAANQSTGLRAVSSSVGVEAHGPCAVSEFLSGSFLPGGGCFFLIVFIGCCWHFLLGFLHLWVGWATRTCEVFRLLPRIATDSRRNQTHWPLVRASCFLHPVSRSGDTCLCPSSRRPLANQRARCARGESKPSSPSL